MYVGICCMCKFVGTCITINSDKDVGICIHILIFIFLHFMDNTYFSIIYLNLYKEMIRLKNKTLTKKLN